MVGAVSIMGSAIVDSHTCPCLCLEALSSSVMNFKSKGDLGLFKNLMGKKQLKRSAGSLELSSSFVDAWQEWRLSAKVISRFVNGQHSRKQNKGRSFVIVDELGGQYEDSFEDVKSAFGFPPAVAGAGGSNQIVIGREGIYKGILVISHQNSRVDSFSANDGCGWSLQLTPTLEESQILSVVLHWIKEDLVYCPSSVPCRQILNYFTYKAVRTVLTQLYEMNPTQYRWLYDFVATNQPGDGKRFIRKLVKEKQDLGERVMVTRLHLYGKWIKKCDHAAIYKEISDENLELMRERLMETVIWPSDDTNTEKIG